MSPLKAFLISVTVFLIYSIFFWLLEFVSLLTLLLILVCCLFHRLFNHVLNSWSHDSIPLLISESSSDACCLFKLPFFFFFCLFLCFMVFLLKAQQNTLEWTEINSPLVWGFMFYWLQVNLAYCVLLVSEITIFSGIFVFVFPVVF